MQGFLDPWAAKNGVFTTRDEKGDYVIALDIPTGEETIIINRCPKEQSYEHKRDHGLLPEQQEKSEKGNSSQRP